eukprot:9494463-Pyramimonas_sp.AAC.1
MTHVALLARKARLGGSLPLSDLLLTSWGSWGHLGAIFGDLGGRCWLGPLGPSRGPHRGPPRLPGSWGPGVGVVLQAY